MNPPPPAYRLVRLPNGASGVFAEDAGEMFHPAVGPEAEASLLYVDQLRLRERAAAEPGPLVIWDVGLGAAGNAMTALHALADLPREVRLESFDRTAAALAFALDHPESFPALAGHSESLRTLARDGSVIFRVGQLRVAWHLHVCEFPELMHDPAATRLARPHAVFWDPHSPARNPDMWTLPLFADVFRNLDPARPCLLATYSRSTMVRVAMLLAGFHVGRGVAVGAKEETTLAANVPGLLTSPLDRAWLDRAQRSGSAEPLERPEYRQAPLGDATAARLEAHPQFQPLEVR